MKDLEKPAKWQDLDQTMLCSAGNNLPALLLAAADTLDFLGEPWPEKEDLKHVTKKIVLYFQCQTK